MNEEIKQKANELLDALTREREATIDRLEHAVKEEWEHYTTSVDSVAILEELLSIKIAIHAISRLI